MIKLSNRPEDWDNPTRRMGQPHVSTSIINILYPI